MKKLLISSLFTLACSGWAFAGPAGPPAGVQILNTTKEQIGANLNIATGTFHSVLVDTITFRKDGTQMTTAGESGVGGSSIYPATGTANFPYGLSSSTITANSGIIETINSTQANISTITLSGSEANTAGGIAKIGDDGYIIQDVINPTITRPLHTVRFGINSYEAIDINNTDNNERTGIQFSRMGIPRWEIGNDLWAEGLNEFSVTYYGTPMKTIKISTNGYVTMGSSATVTNRLTADSIYVSSIVTAGKYVGDGSELTGIVSTAPKVISDLDDVNDSGRTKNYALLFNGTDWVAAAQGTSFTFSINTFTDNQSATIEMGPANTAWQTAGNMTFSATYNNGPPSNSYVSHTGWTNLTMTNSFEGPTSNVDIASYPASPGSKTWTLNATDGTDNDTDTITIAFYNRRFWGVSSTASGFSEADIESLSNNELSNSKAKTFTVTAGSGEYILYCYPSRLGTVTFTVGGFEGGFQPPETVSVTNSPGYTENYYAYRSTNHSLGSTTVVAQ